MSANRSPRFPHRLPIVAAWFLPLACLAAWGQPPEQPRGEAKYLTRGELLRQYDQDGDGTLSRAERQMMLQDIRDGRADVPPQVRENLFRAFGGGQPPPRQAAAVQAGGARSLEDVVVQRDIVYGDAGGRPLKLDLVLPTAQRDGLRPVIVFIHGGGWSSGDKSAGVGRLGPLVATGNYVGVSVGYRLSGEAIWPAQIHDCKAAIRWLRANAEEYQIDPQRIGVWGSSAGGHLANMLGTSGDVAELEGDGGSPGHSSRVACAVPFCGPANFLAPTRFQGGREPSAVDGLLGDRIDARRELARHASPLTYVSPDDPPFLIVHGTADATVPFEQAQMLHDALHEAGVDVTFIKMLGGGHAIGGEEVLQRVQAFFERHLRGQQVQLSAEPIDTRT